MELPMAPILDAMSDDLLVEILARLPVKSTARFKCVSRGWCDVISDEYLRRRLPFHVSAVYFADCPDGGDKEQGYACAAVDSAGGRLEGCDLSFFPHREGGEVLVDGCNGLLLYCAPRAMEYYVVNPVTRRWVALPRPSKEARIAFLAFDPCSSPHYYVVTFTGWREQGAAMEVFSSETGGWAERDACFGLPPDSLSPAMHYHAGVVYLLAAPDRLVCMSLTDDLACTVADLPEPVGRDGRVAHCGGRLHYMNSTDQELKIWTFTEPAACQWELKHVVAIGDVVKELPCWASTEVCRFLALHPERDDVVFLWLPWRLVCYDPRKKAIERAWEVGKEGKNRVVKIWLVPSSCYLSDCLAGGDAAMQNQQLGHW